MIFRPHNYQAYCIQRILSDDKLGLFLDMGLGKTAITLTAVHELMYNRFLVRKVLVIAPKKVAEGTWTKEADKWDHLRGLRIRTVLGSRQQRIRALYAPGDVWVINRDNVAWLVDFYRNDWPFDMVIVDEMFSFKSASSQRFKKLRNMLPHIRRLVGLTGTPAPNGLEDLWAQIYLLDQGRRLGPTLSGFRERYFNHNPYRHEYKAKPEAEDAVQEAIRDICVSMSAEDYLDLPPLVVDDIPVVLDPAAQKAYNTLEHDMLLEFDGDEIVATAAVTLSNKLLQLCSGAVYGLDRKVIQIHNCKLQALLEAVEGLGGQRALLFYGFRHDIPRIREVLPKSLQVRELSGPADCDAWNAGQVDILLAHPASCAYGLNLQQGGHHVIWYSLPWSLELYQQANARLCRQGQRCPVIAHRLLVDGGLDMDVAAALEDKRDTQDALLGALKARIEKAKEAN